MASRLTPPSSRPISTLPHQNRAASGGRVGATAAVYSAAILGESHHPTRRSLRGNESTRDNTHNQRRFFVFLFLPSPFSLDPTPTPAPPCCCFFPAAMRGEPNGVLGRWRRSGVASVALPIPSPLPTLITYGVRHPISSPPTRVSRPANTTLGRTMFFEKRRNTAFPPKIK